jgi:hypothetical protein
MHRKEALGLWTLDETLDLSESVSQQPERGSLSCLIRRHTCVCVCVCVCPSGMVSEHWMKG